MPHNKRPFGVYVHWPFCLSKCPYCDFNSHVRAHVDHAQWAAALMQEIQYFSMHIAPRPIDSIFFGGGTPSLMAPQTVEAVLSCLQQQWGFSKNIEITLEANPTSVEADKFAAFAGLGVNRLSLGVQSLRPQALKMLGREHSVEDARRAIELASKHFPRYSFDLIYARPDQSLAAWNDELSEAISMAGDHLSLYQLTIEKGTAFYTQWRQGKLQIPAEEQAADFYNLTQDICSGAQLPAYEISNHAAVGGESRHNLVYWTYGDYVGIGPGAHGRLTLVDGQRVAYHQHRLPEAWMAAISDNGHGTAQREVLSMRHQAEEMLMMGLRLTAGVSLRDFQDCIGRPVSDYIDMEKLGSFKEQGLVVDDPQCLKLTGDGRLVMNNLLGQLLT
ncbi:MAG: coproporphyrinogen III oxidase [Kordiimonas sp.]|nr:coproporphyrinogen III oxidase [Kordiimonas sp.]